MSALGVVRAERFELAGLALDRGGDDPDQRRRVGEQYRKEVEWRCTKMLASKESAGDEAGARITRSVLYLAQRMADVPVLVIPCYDIDAAADRYGRLLGAERAPAEMTPAMFASILPAVWSFQLALRSRGLGSTLTTAHQEDQPAMAQILGIPDGWYQVALIPCASQPAVTSVPPAATRWRTP